MPQVQKRLFASSIKNGGLPNITGKISFRGSNSSSVYNLSTGGAFRSEGAVSGAQVGNQAGGQYMTDYFSLDASRSSPIFGATSYVMPRHLIVLYCIKH